MTDPITRYTAQLAAARDESDCFAALHGLADALLGARLFTVMTIDLADGLARRAYTSDPVAYPGAGTKPILRNAWFQRIHDKHDPFVANTLTEIAEVFPDHALIAALGCGSCLNLPVVRGGDLVATVNMLDAEGFWTKSRLDTAIDRMTLPSMAAVAHADCLSGGASRR